MPVGAAASRELGMIPRSLRPASGGAVMFFSMTAPPGGGPNIMETQDMMDIDPMRGGPIARLLRRTWSFTSFLGRGSNRLTVASPPKILVVVEGLNDIEFLRRISAMLHRDDSCVLDLAEMERRLALVFVPAGGSDLSSAFRFVGLQLPEFHILDRDLPPATQSRHRIAAMVNSRPRCHAVVTSKRSLENYLHDTAVFEASGLSIAVSDEENVPELTARQIHDRHVEGLPWDQLPIRARKRLREKAKKWLNTLAAERMTPERLAERDPKGEVRSWLATVGVLIRAQ